MERERTATFYNFGQKFTHPEYSMIDLVDDDSSDKRPGLKIQNLDVSVLTTSVDRFSPYYDG